MKTPRPSLGASALAVLGRIPLLRRLAHRRLLMAAVAVAAVVSLGFGAGSAYAYFTSSGSGTGSAATGTVQSVDSVSFVAGDVVTTPLLPGGSGDAIMRVTNNNSFPVTLVSFSPGTVAVSNASGSCPAGSVTANSLSGLNITINAGPSSSQLVDLSGAVTMHSDAPTGCQHATFTLTGSSFQVQK